MKKLIPLFLILALALIFTACPPPHPQTVQVEVCSESGLLPTPWCPAKEVRIFTIGQQPTIPCQVHKSVKVCAETGRRAVACCPDVVEVAEAEAPDLYCLRHARNPLASPWLVLAWLDLQSKCQRFTDEEMDTFARRVGEAGVRYVRIFYPGWQDDVDIAGTVFPYLREADGRWNLDKPNPAYDENLRRIARHLSKYEVGLYIDMADQCGWDSYWDFWRRNVNGVMSWKDESPAAFDRWRSAVFRVLTAIGGVEGNIIGLGNELFNGDDFEDSWVINWGKPRIDYLLSLGFPKPIFYSAGGRLAHKLGGILSAEDEIYPDNFYCTIVEHGIGIVEHVSEEWISGYSKFHWLGLSDDGVDCHEWNKIPPDKKGTCDKYGGCSASVAEKIKLIKLFLQYFNEGQLRLIEFLPREISFDEGPGVLAEQSLEVFWRIGLEVFGIDPRRTF